MLFQNRHFFLNSFLVPRLSIRLSRGFDFYVFIPAFIGCRRSLNSFAICIANIIIDNRSVKILCYNIIQRHIVRNFIDIL